MRICQTVMISVLLASCSTAAQPAKTQSGADIVALLASEQRRRSARTMRFLDLLKQEGVGIVFGNPGTTELPLMDAFAVEHDIRYILGLQEAALMAMADGYAQATRNASMVNLHSAAGVGHAMGNIFTAFRNQTPMIVTASSSSVQSQ